MSNESNSNKKIASSQYNPVTRETTITYTDGSTSTIFGEGRSLGAGVNATASSTSPKMKKINDEDKEDEDKS